ncbi:MAG: hypothetical protein HND58_16695 [Planctomycetota bacterium]|nr:MAG: hypothetical protein HND58_16695 [Planctomycetota bacterium]
MKGIDLNTASAETPRKDVPTCDAEHVLDAAAGLLGQCGRIVEAMDDESYCCTSTVLAGGTIGKHLRHTLDHFGAILTGTQRDEAIDYDHRARGVAVETDRSAAIEQIDGLRSGLTGLQNDLGGPVRIRVMLSGDGTEAELDSTVVREVAFATHHGIHHVAMMKAIAGEMGVSLDGDIGKAPSTIQHERGANTATQTQTGA